MMHLVNNKLASFNGESQCIVAVAVVTHVSLRIEADYGDQYADEFANDTQDFGRLFLPEVGIIYSFHNVISLINYTVSQLKHRPMMCSVKAPDKCLLVT